MDRDTAGVSDWRFDTREGILSACDSITQRLEVVNHPPMGYYGQTALQATSMRGHDLVAQALIEAGADVNAPGGNNIYRNAFELACGTGWYRSGCRDCGRSG